MRDNLLTFLQPVSNEVFWLCGEILCFCALSTGVRSYEIFFCVG